MNRKLRAVHVPAREYTLRIRMSPHEVGRLNALIDEAGVPASSVIRTLIDREFARMMLRGPVKQEELPCNTFGDDAREEAKRRPPQ